VPQPPDTGPARKQVVETQTAGPGRPHLRTDLALLALSVIWGVNFSVIKIALREFEPLAFNALRFVLASSTLFVFLRLRGAVPLPARRHWIRVVSLGLLANVVYQLLFIYGVDRTLAGNAGLVLATTPVWTLILASCRVSPQMLQIQVSDMLVSFAIRGSTKSNKNPRPDGTGRR